MKRNPIGNQISFWLRFACYRKRGQMVVDKVVKWIIALSIIIVVIVAARGIIGKFA